MAWKPQRSDEENHIDQLRLPSKEQEGERRILTMGIQDEGMRQIIYALGHKIDGWRNAALVLGDWTNLDEGVYEYYSDCIRPSPDWETPEGHRNLGSQNYFWDPGDRVYMPDWNSAQNVYTEHPEIMEKEWLEKVREAVDSIYRVEYEPQVGYRVGPPPAYDPLNPEFKWIQPIDKKLKSWEIEQLQLKLAALSWNIPNTHDYFTVEGKRNGLSPEHIGPWPAFFFSYYPYPEGAPVPEDYEFSSTIDLDKTLEEATSLADYSGRIGMFWTLAGYKRVETRNYRGCHKSEPYEPISDYVQIEFARTAGLTHFGPIDFEGNFVDCGGTFSFPTYEFWKRTGDPQLSGSGHIVIDDTYLEEGQYPFVRFCVVQQHPFHPEVFLKPVRDMMIDLQGVPSWFDFFPGFDLSKWPHIP